MKDIQSAQCFSAWWDGNYDEKT